MTEEPEGYSSADEKLKARKEMREKSNLIRRREAKQYEPRRYTEAQQDYARRFNRGTTYYGGVD